MRIDVLVAFIREFLDRAERERALAVRGGVRLVKGGTPTPIALTAARRPVADGAVAKEAS
jgi:hypothetical protein